MGKRLGDHMNQLMDRTDSCTPNNPGVFVAEQLLRRKLAILMLMILTREAVLKTIIFNASPIILKQVTAVKKIIAEPHASVFYCWCSPPNSDTDSLSYKTDTTNPYAES